MVYNGTNINVMQSTFNQNNATNGGAIYFEVSLSHILLFTAYLQSRVSSISSSSTSQLG